MDIINHFIDFMAHEIHPSYSETDVSLECSVDVPCTLFFATRSNTESMFL
jgi:hypothetical protein